MRIFVRPYLQVDSHVWPVSTGGGTRPLWSRNGDELFYVSPTGAIMRVDVKDATTWPATTPTQLLKEGYRTISDPEFGRSYDVARDGRFLMIKAGNEDGATGTPPRLTVVFNWFEELTRLVPDEIATPTTGRRSRCPVARR